MCCRNFCTKIALFSNERHFEIWFPKKKTITYFWSKLFKLHRKRPNFACDNYVFPKTRGNKANIVPIPHPLTEGEEEGEKDVDGESGVEISWGHSLYKVTYMWIRDLKSRGLLVTNKRAKGLSFGDRLTEEGVFSKCWIIGQYFKQISYYKWWARTVSRNSIYILYWILANNYGVFGRRSFFFFFFFFFMSEHI